MNNGGIASGDGYKNVGEIAISPTLFIIHYSFIKSVRYGGPSGRPVPTNSIDTFRHSAFGDSAHCGHCQPAIIDAPLEKQKKLLSLVDFCRRVWYGYPAK